MTRDTDDLTTDELADEYDLDLDALHELRSDEQVLRLVERGVHHLDEMERLSDVAKPTLRDRANEHADADRIAKIRDGRTFRYEPLDEDGESDEDDSEEATSEPESESEDDEGDDTLDIADDDENDDSDQESAEPCGAETAGGGECEWTPAEACPHHTTQDEPGQAFEDSETLDDDIPDGLDRDYPDGWAIEGVQEADPLVIRWEGPGVESIVMSDQAEDAELSVVHQPDEGDAEFELFDDTDEAAQHVMAIMADEDGETTDDSILANVAETEGAYLDAVDTFADWRGDDEAAGTTIKTFADLIDGGVSEDDGSPTADYAGTTGDLEEPEVAVDDFDTTSDEPAGDMHVAAPGHEREGIMPVDRRIDWESYIPDEDDIDYRQIDNELDRIMSQIDSRDETGMIPHFALSAPSGSAKTKLARIIANERGIPLFTIQCSEGMLMQDVIGGATAVGDETHWVDGTGVKFLLASMDADEFEEQYGHEGWDGEAMLLIDEVNRTTSKTKSALMSLLDHRAQLILDARGGEIIDGDAMSGIVLSTMNEGPGYDTNSIDTAEKRRLGYKLSLKWLGYDRNGHNGDAIEEIELVTEMSPASTPLAKQLVETANDLRELAENQGSAISYGPSAANVIDWAKAAHGEPDCIDEPVVRAFEAVVQDWHLSDSDDERGKAESVVDRNLGGCPVGEEAVREWAGETITDDTVFECYDCGWFADDPDEVDDATKALMVCPEDDCSGDIDSYEGH